MSPEEVKQWVDLLIALMSTGCGGAIVIAFVGAWKQKREPVEGPPKPTIGTPGLASIGGMLLAQSELEKFTEGLRLIAASHDRCTLARETEIALHRTMQKEEAAERQKLAEDLRHHERNLAQVQNDNLRRIADGLDTLNHRIRDMPGCSA